MRLIHITLPLTPVSLFPQFRMHRYTLLLKSLLAPRAPVILLDRRSAEDDPLRILVKIRDGIVEVVRRAAQLVDQRLDITQPAAREPLQIVGNRPDAPIEV